MYTGVSNSLASWTLFAVQVNLNDGLTVVSGENTVKLNAKIMFHLMEWIFLKYLKQYQGWVYI